MTTAADRRQVLIVGAGPGGLQLGYFLEQMGIDYCILERGQGAGNFFRAFPRGRRLISLNKVNNGGIRGETQLRWDWNSLLEREQGEHFRRFDLNYYPEADSMVAYLADFAFRHSLKVRPNTTADFIDRTDAGFVVRTNNGDSIACETLVVATGTSLPHVPPIPGIEHSQGYADFDSTEHFRDKRVLIIGKGNSAFEIAERLLPLAQAIDLVSPSLLRVAARTHFAGDLRSINNTFLDTFFFKQQNAIINAKISRIHKLKDGISVDLMYTEDGEIESFTYDFVINCTGFKFDRAMFAGSCLPEVDDMTELPLLTSEWQSRNIEGMYFAGTLMHQNDFRGSGSSFIKGIRYNAQALADVIALRASGIVAPVTRIVSDKDTLVRDLFARVQSSASLWHLWGSLCDAYVYNPSDNEFVVHRDIPQRAVTDRGLFAGASGFVLQFTHSNPKDAVERQKFSPVGFIHPLLKLFADNAELAEAHVLEDVHAEWKDSERWRGPINKLFDMFIAQRDGLSSRDDRAGAGRVETRSEMARP